jgi:hypothetical protein
MIAGERHSDRRERNPVRNLGHMIGDFHQQESGQVTFLFVFASVALILLLAYILNTAKQSGRKIEMQGSADAAAVAGGLWMARGMNVMTLNNKGMADLLAVMISLRSVVQTADAMQKILPPTIAGLYTAAVYLVQPELADIADELSEEEAFYLYLATELKPLDGQLSDASNGSGWEMMRDLDRLNQVIKVKLPIGVEVEAVRYARLNGADSPPFSLLLSGREDSKLMFPVGRGGKGQVAKQAKDCTIDKMLGVPVKETLIAACSLYTGFPCISGFIAWPVFDNSVLQNVSALSGGQRVAAKAQFTPSDFKRLPDFYNGSGRTVQDIIDDYNAEHDSGDGNYHPKGADDLLKSVSYNTSGSLNWPQDPPLPMVLTDQPKPEGEAVIPDGAEGPDLLMVRKNLQFLAFSFGKSNGGVIASKQFTNPSPYGWLTYGEADVYHPITWSTFDQNWRVKLARASLLNTKWTALLNLTGVHSFTTMDFSYVNTH